MASQMLLQRCPDKVTIQILVAENDLYKLLQSCSWQKWKALKHHRRGYDETTVQGMEAYESWLRSADPGTDVANAPITALPEEMTFADFNAEAFCRQKFVCIAQCRGVKKNSKTRNLIKKFLAPFENGVGVRMPSSSVVRLYHILHLPPSLLQLYIIYHTFKYRYRYIQYISLSHPSRQGSS